MISEEFILEVEGRNIIMYKRRGFTLIELLVVIAIIAVLMAILMPALRRAQEQGKRAACLNSLKQLMLAWSMYADSNGDKIVNGDATFSGGTEGRAVVPTAGFHANELPWVGNCVAPGYANGDLLAEEVQIAGIEAGALWPYLKNTGLYKCPTGYRGEMITYSIVDSMNGRWESRTDAAKARIVKVKTQIRTPGEKIVFVDEGFMTPDSYAIYYDTPKDTWWDAPTVRHGNGTDYGFADGHSEHRTWKGRDTVEIGKSLDKNHTPGAPGMKATTPDGMRDVYMVQKAVWGKLGYVPTVPP
jgi:prepilin-type N-terminal cleavage/methylation domain-containing protein/prepilin-type processing-associated H-X9-DG protein